MSLGSYWRINGPLHLAYGEDYIFEEWTATKKTNKGMWIEQYGCRKFVLDEGRKRYAHPTKMDALNSFIARKKKQVKILIGQSADASLDLKHAEEYRAALETK